MPFADEYRAGHDSIDRTQHRQCSFVKLESGGVPTQGVIVEAKGLPQSKVAEPPVEWIGIGKRQALSWDGDVHLRLGNGERELKLDRALQVHSLYQRFETIARHLQRIHPRLQIRGDKFAQPVR